MWSSVSSIPDKKDAVVCPKPRRLGLLNATINEPIRPLRWHVRLICGYHPRKGGGGADQSSAAQVASSPHFLWVTAEQSINPLIQDARFGDEKVTPVSPRAIPVPSGLASSPSASARRNPVREGKFWQQSGCQS
ncbi:hypothetical protein HAX54_014761 [Datura stramonium]|uniref:Uncharacterized protein n=1 Tax=Datura stramonium TaxID=4076 RepID=A0ABS8TNM0_DATST|nr:hypothetical protein [Datura stramonium]